MDNFNENKASLSVRFPDPGQNADVIIKEILERQSNLRRFFVVSNDREVLSSARSKGAQLFSCREFNAQLKEAIKEYRQKSEMVKPESQLTPLEVNHMAELFRGKK